MSLAATRWAWLQSLHAADKIVLLRLADRANDERICWPAVASLALDTGMNERSVRRALPRLEASGLIGIAHQTARGRKIQSRYTLNLTAGQQADSRAAPDLTESPLDLTQSPMHLTQSPIGPDTESDKSTTQSTRESKKDPVPQNTTEEAETERSFQIFWNRYPRKEGMNEARVAFQTALAKTPLRTIGQGVNALLDNLPDDRRFLLKPARWLKEERWTDRPGTKAVQRRIPIRAGSISLEEAARLGL